MQNVVAEAAHTRLVLGEIPLAQVVLPGRDLRDRLGLLGRIGSFLADRSVAIRALNSSDRSVVLYVDQDAAPRVVDDLRGAFVGIARPFAGLVSRGPFVELCAANPAFAGATGVVAALAAALAREGIDIVDLATGHAEVVVYLHQADGPRALAALAALLGTG